MFPTVIAEVTTEEFERIQRAELMLPNVWSLVNNQQFNRPKAA